jgi:hypothetical protein
VSRPIPQSRFVGKYQDNFDRIFGKKVEKKLPYAEHFTFDSMEESHAHWEKLTGKKIAESGEHDD